MISNFSKKVLSIVVIIAILFSTVVADMVLSADSNSSQQTNEEPPIIVNFDSMPSDFMTGLATTGTFSISDDKGINNTSALKYSSSNNNIAYQLLNDGVSPLLLDENASYTITFNYFVESGINPVLVYVRAATDKNKFYDYTEISTGEKLELTAQGQWIKKTVILNTNNFKTGKKGLANQFFIGFSSSNGTVVYFDDIEITKIIDKNDENNSGIYVDYGFDNNSKIYLGKIGNQLIIDTVGREGYQFMDWYSDESLTEKFTAGTFESKGLKKIHAYWYKTETYEITFDDMPEALTENENGNWVTSTSALSIEDNKGIENTKALKRAEVSDNGSKYQALNDGESILKLEQNTDYQIKLRYFVEKTGNDIQFKIKTAVGLNVFYDPTPDILTANLDLSKVGKWITKTFYFTTNTFKTSKNGILGDSAFIELNGKSDSVVYFDNIEIVKIRKTTDEISAVYLDYGYDDKTELIVGKKGDNITVPTPARSDARFIGWYEDEELTKPTIVPEIFTDDIVSLYAGWFVLETKVITFDDMPDSMKSNSDGNFVTSTNTFTFANGKGIDGSVALRRELTQNNDQGYNKCQALNDGQSSLKLNANTTYLMRIHYYVEKSDLPISVKVRAAASNNMYYNPIELISTSIDANEQDKWLTKTFFFTTPESFETTKQGGFCNFAYIELGGKGKSIVYFDNIELISVCTKGDGYGAVCVEYGYDDKYDLIIGNIDEDISVDIPKRDGMQFVDWYTDERYTTTITVPEKIAKEPTCIFANWFTPNNHIVTFDDMPSDFMENNSDESKFVTSGGYSLAEGKGQNNSVALKKGTTESNAVILQALNDGQELISLKNKTSYKVTVNYCFEKVSGTVMASIATAKAYNHWYNRAFPVEEMELNGKVGEWQSVTFVFTTEDLGIFNCAYLGVSGNKDAIVYFDNIEIVELGPDDILLTYVVPELDLKGYSLGKEGNLIDLTNVPKMKTTKNYIFNGWFVDENYTIPFESNVYPDKNMMVYGKITMRETISVNFDDYAFSTEKGTFYIQSDIMEIYKGLSSDGDGFSLKVDNSREGQSRYERPILLNLGEKALQLEDGAKYLITYDFYIENGCNDNMSIDFASAGLTNMWDDRTSFTKVVDVLQSGFEHKTWLTSYAVGTVQVKKEGKNGLVMNVKQPYAGIMYIDNIRLKKISSDNMVVIYQSDCSVSPEPAIVKKGSRTKLPTLSLPTGKHLGSWYNGETAITGNSIVVNEDMYLLGKTYTNGAVENFEKTEYMLRGINGFGWDHDWEIYDSKLESNSVDNVTSGRFSLHRVGDEPSFKAYCLQNNGYFSMYALEELKRFTVSFNVKIEDPVHTLGAISLSCLNTSLNPWDLSGYEMYVTSIASVADGEWHNVSYTFIATSPYLTIITPGNLSIYIDDVKIDAVSDDVPLSTNCEFEEYIPKFLNENGEYEIDSDTSLEKFEIVKRVNVETQPSVGIWVWCVIAAGAVIFIVGAILLIIFISKKRAGGSKQ